MDDSFNAVLYTVSNSQDESRKQLNKARDIKKSTYNVRLKVFLLFLIENQQSWRNQLFILIGIDLAVTFVRRILLKLVFLELDN